MWVLTMTEYINREAIRDALYDADAITMEGVKILNQFPPSDVAPVRHGQWGVDGVYVVCSVCNRITLSPIVKMLPTFKYCTNCGAKMDEVSA